MPSQIDWDAISAIGQVLGAIITAIAVVIALRKDKPKIHVHVPIMKYDNKEYVEVYVTNIGYMPVSVWAVTCVFPRQKVWQTPELLEPTYLMPGQKHMIAKESKEKFKKFENKSYGELRELSSEEIWKSLCVMDHTGRIHFQSGKLSVRIRRFFLIKLPIYLGIKLMPRM